MALQSRPSAISLMVKSNSLRGDEIDRRARLPGLRRGSTATLAPTKPALSAGLASLSASTTLHVGSEGRRRGVQHDEIVVARLRQRRRRARSVRRRVDQLAARHQRGGLGEPGRIPERPDLAPRLIARAGAAIEAVEGRSLQT